MASSATFTPALTPLEAFSSSGPPRLRITKTDGTVIYSNEYEGVIRFYPSPSEVVSAIAHADDPQTCALLRECARQVFRRGPVDKLADWGDHFLCVEVGPRKDAEPTGSGSGREIDTGRLKSLHLTAQRGVCGYTFKRGDLCWNCRSCQTDPTCVQCDPCFRASDHAGHEVYFHQASPGGCCDCGDLEAWDRAGCCTAHSGSDPCQDPVDSLPTSMRLPARVVLAEAVALVTDACLQAVQGYNSSHTHGFLVPGPVPPVADEDSGLRNHPRSGEDRGHCILRLHNDDVHTFNHVTDALLRLSIPSARARTLTERVDSHGHAVVARGSAPQLGRKLSSLVAQGLLVSLVDERQSEREERAVRLLRWMTGLATQVEGLARILSELISDAWPLRLQQLGYERGTRWCTPQVRIYQPAPDDAALLLATMDASLSLSDPRQSSRLALLLVADFFLTNQLRTELQALYLHLLVDAHFKPALARSLTRCYTLLNSLYSRGVGTQDDSLFSFSVQLYTTPSIVRWLATSTEDEELLGSPGLMRVLTEALLAAFRLAGWCDGQPLSQGFWENPLLQHRRYAHLLRDMDYALQTEGTAAGVLRQAYPGPGPRPLRAWVEALSMMQHADPMVRKTGTHLEFESSVWMQAFTLSFPLYSTSTTLIAHGLRALLDAAPPSPSPPGHRVTAREKEGGETGDADWSDRLLRFRNVTEAAVEGIRAWMTRALKGGEDAYAMKVEGYREAGTGLILERPGIGVRVHEACVSFHIPLHRFLAAAVLEGAAQGFPFPTHVGAQPAFEDPSSPALKDAPHLSSCLADFPLRCLALSAQIAAGLWRRNGLSVQASSIHYTTPPFCRVFRDLDLAAIQLAILLEGNETVLGMLLGHFCLKRWALEPTRSLGREEAAFEDKDLLALAEECLLVLILLVTELPRPRGASHREAVLRRELVHRLACKEGLTHSEVQQMTTLVHNLDMEGLDPGITGENGARDDGKDRQAAFDSILARVAVRRQGTDAARFDLRPECAREYDGTFFHISRQEHEAALERIVGLRKQVERHDEGLGKRDPTPCVCPPPVAHPDFAPVRLLLYWPEVLAFQYTVLLAAAIPDSPAAASKRSPLLLVRCLHILNLQLHVLHDATRIEAEARQVLPPVVSAYKRRNDRPVQDFFESLARRRSKSSGLMRPWMEERGDSDDPRRTSFQHDSSASRGVAGFGGALEEDRSYSNTISEQASPGREISEVETGGEDGPSILELLVMLAQDDRRLGLNIGPVYEEGLFWALRQLHNVYLDRFPRETGAQTLLSPFGRRDVEEEGTERTENGKGKRSGTRSRSDHARRAQAKAMKFFQQQQNKFWEGQTQGSDGDEGEQGQANGSSSTVGDACGLEAGAPACLYCHERTGSALAYIGFAQRSNALAHAIADSPSHARLAQRYRVSHRECLVRSGPDLGSAEVQRLGRGTFLVVEEKRGRRLRVSHPTQGWVSEFSSDRHRLVEPMSPYCFQQWGKTRVLVTLCGHVCHQDCWDSFYANVLQEMISEERVDGRHAIDVARREFLCPLCKSLSNVLVPHIPPDQDVSAAAGETGREGSTGALSLASLVDWTLGDTSLVDGSGGCGGAGSVGLLDELTRLDLPTPDHGETPLSTSSPLSSSRSSKTDSSCLPNALTRNIRRFADSLGEVLELPWCKLGFEGEEGGRGSLGSGPEKLIKALHVGWSTAAYSLLLEVVNKNTLARQRRERDEEEKEGGQGGSGEETEGGMGAVGQVNGVDERRRHLRQLLLAVRSLTALARDRQHLAGSVVQPMWRLFAASSLSPSTEVRDRRENTQSDTLIESRTAAMQEVPLSLLLDSELYFTRHRVRGKEDPVAPVDRLRLLHTHRRAAGEAGLVEAWGFWERPLLSHDLSTLAVGALTLALHSPPIVLRLVRLLALARLAQVLLEPGSVQLGGEALTATELSHGVRHEPCAVVEEAGEMGGESGPSRDRRLLRLSRAVRGGHRGDLRVVEGLVVSRWRPFLQLLDLLLDALGFKGSVGEPLNAARGTATTVPEFLRRVGLEDSFLDEHNATDSDALDFLFTTWGVQYRGFVTHLPSFNDGMDASVSGLLAEAPAANGPSTVGSLPSTPLAPPAMSPSVSRRPSSASASSPPVPPSGLTPDGAPDAAVTRLPLDGPQTAQQAVSSLPLPAHAGSAPRSMPLPALLPDAVNGYRGNVRLGEEHGEDGSRGAGRGRDAGREEAVGAQAAGGLDQEIESEGGGPVVVSQGSRYFATPYFPSLDGTFTMPGMDVDSPRPGPLQNSAQEDLPLYDLSHFGVSDDVDLRLVPLPEHYTQLYSLLKDQYWTVASSTSHASGDRIGGGSAGAGEVRRGIEDPALCLLCGAILAAGPRMHGGTHIGSPGVCTLHARACGSGTGLMLLINKGSILLFRDNRATFYPSPYVDQYGEEDPNLRRGRPLSLSEGRYERLTALYRNHGVPREVASRRVNADRVIREGYY